MRPPLLSHKRVVRAFQRAGFRWTLKGIIQDAGLAIEEFKDFI